MVFLLISFLYGFFYFLKFFDCFFQNVQWDSRGSKSLCLKGWLVMTEKEVRKIVLLLEISKVAKRLAENLIRFRLNQSKKKGKKVF